MSDVTASMVVDHMMTMQGGDWRYRFGAEINDVPNAGGSKLVDCSEATEAAVRWAAQSVGSPLRLTDGSFAQYDACYKAHTLIPLAQARQTPGALVFLSKRHDVTPGMGRNGIFHVGIIRSPEVVLEACCRNGDVVRPVDFDRRSWHHLGGLIPGVVYPAAPPPEPVTPPSEQLVLIEVI
jgi:hypothetical protein